MKFTKMQGAGNDYVYVDCTKAVPFNPSELAVVVSDRHFGIGADGLILIKTSQRADFFMEMYNADGSQGRMCGNGIRCVGKFVYDNGLTDKEQITVETLAGIKTLELMVENKKVARVRVDMGEPILQPAAIPITAGGDNFISRPVEVGGREWKLTCVSMGNPHAVTYVEDTESLDLKAIGPLFENHSLFPDRINTEFIQVLDRRNLKMRVWERGSGETLACGTGACAALVATVLCGLCEPRATLHLRGGDLEIEWEQKTNVVYLTGAAETVFTGEYPWQEQDRI